MRRKHIWFLGLLGCIVVLRTGQVAGAPETLRFFFWGTQPRLEGVQASIGAFHRKYPEMNVRVEPEFVSWGDYFQKMPVLLAAGELPDVVWAESGNIYGQLIRPMDDPPLLDLAPYMKRDNFNMDGFDTRNWPLLTHRGRVLGVPWAHVMGAGQTLGYNMRMFDEAGIAYPDENWTWQADFIPASRKLTKKAAADQVERYGSNFVASFRGFWAQVLYTYGGRIFSADNTAVALNDPRAYAALQLIRDLRANGLAVWGSTNDLMTKGQIAMGFEWWSIQSSILGQMADAYGVTVYPKGPAGHGIFQGPMANPAHSLVISRNTKHPDEAWTFVRFMTTEEEALMAWRGGREKPPVPYRPLVRKWGELLTPGERERWLPAAILWDELAVRVDQPVDPTDTNTREIDAIFAEEFTRLFNGEIPVEAAVAQAKQRVEAVMRQNR